MLIVCLTRSATGFGKAAYDSAGASASPLSIIQFRKPTIALPFAESFGGSGISSHVKLEIGYESAPGASVIDTL